MSKTIKTRSGTKFLTNISSEQLLGDLLYICGAKHEKEMFVDKVIYNMPYEMSEAEVKDANEKLLSLLNKSKEIFQELHFYFGHDGEEEELHYFIKEYAKLLADSNGYECLT